jgi:hypothetical protein
MHGGTKIAANLRARNPATGSDVERCAIERLDVRWPVCIADRCSGSPD